MRCDDLVSVLPGVVDGSVSLEADAAEHVASCLRCQAELVQYRKLLRALRGLRSDVVEPAPGLLQEIVAGLDGHPATRTVRRVASFGAIAAAAGAAGVVLASRGWRGRARLAG